MKAIGVAAAVVGALLAAAPADAQQQRFPDPLVLVGPGSAIGARVREVTADEAKTAKLEAPTGVYIVEVDPNTPAERAGLKSGDIVVEFDGEHVRSVRGFSRLVSETPPNRTVKATIVRGGTRTTLDVTPINSERLAMNRVTPDLPRPPARPNPPTYRFRAEPFRLPDTPQLAPPPPRLGIELSPIDGQMSDFFGVSAGVLVSSVDRDSPAARAGLKAGDVVTAVNGHAVRQPGEMSNEVRNATGPIELTVVRDKKEMKVRVIPDLGGGAAVRLPV